MTDKAKGVLSYVFSWVGGLIFLLMKDSSQNVKKHAAQSIVISVGYFAITIAYSMIPFSIPFFSTGLNVLYGILIIMGIVKVCQEGAPELPVVGKLAESIFGKKIHE